MATNFPTSLDTLTNPTSTDTTTSVDHAAQHANVNDAVEALEAKVGVDSSAVTSSLDYKVSNASSVDPGHLHSLESGISDVDTTGKVNGSGLFYNSTSGNWEAGSTSVADASTSVKGVTKLSTAPASATNPIAVGDNDPRVPSADENDALVGTSGTSPSATNLFIDEQALTGVVLPFAGASAPTGWLLCYGQAVSRTTYSRLFTLISTTYGVGDGSTTFNLPDMRGNFPLGKDNMGGVSRNRVTHANADSLGGEEGSETHTLTSSEMPSHSHTTTSGTGFVVNVGTGGTINLGGGSSGATQANTETAGSGSAHENMSPYITLNYIIKT